MAARVPTPLPGVVPGVATAPSWVEEAKKLAEYIKKWYEDIVTIADYDIAKNRVVALKPKNPSDYAQVKRFLDEVVKFLDTIASKYDVNAFKLIVNNVRNYTDEIARVVADVASGKKKELTTTEWKYILYYLLLCRLAGYLKHSRRKYIWEAIVEAAEKASSPEELTTKLRRMFIANVALAKRALHNKYSYMSEVKDVTELVKKPGTSYFKVPGEAMSEFDAELGTRGRLSSKIVERYAEITGEKSTTIDIDKLFSAPNFTSIAAKLYAGVKLIDKIREAFPGGTVEVRVGDSVDKVRFKHAELVTDTDRELVDKLSEEHRTVKRVIEKEVTEPTDIDLVMRLFKVGDKPLWEYFTKAAEVYMKESRRGAGMASPGFIAYQYAFRLFGKLFTGARELSRIIRSSELKNLRLKRTDLFLLRRALGELVRQKVKEKLGDKKKIESEEDARKAVEAAIEAVKELYKRIRDAAHKHGIEVRVVQPAVAA